jgi:hypothetical protein
VTESYEAVLATLRWVQKPSDNVTGAITAREPDYVVVTGTSTALPLANPWEYSVQPVRQEPSLTEVVSFPVGIAYWSGRYAHHPATYFLGDRFHTASVLGKARAIVEAKIGKHDRRTQALEILRSWLEPHESDDQVAALRQLKDDLNESRHGQRKLFRD